MRWRWLGMIACGISAVACAAPIEHDLGQGLVYVRVRELPADLPGRPAGRVAPCVIDLRYVATTPEGAEAFMAWARFRSTPRTPVFILANGETSAPLRAVLATHPRGTGIVVLGVPAAEFRPDVAVKSKAEIERRTYDAFGEGVALAKLLADNPDKVRNDEASLSKDRLAEAPADAASDALAGGRPPPPIDLTLQRAVHLHRSLVALKKI